MWRVAQCAVQGRSHIVAGIPCQDVTCAYSSNGVEVIALADGAGSAKHSREGAELVTQHICRHLAEHFEHYTLTEDVSAAQEELIAGILNILTERAKEEGYAVKELASTLLAVAIKDEHYLLLHLGDGILGYRKDGELKVASTPINGEFANETYFTTSKLAARRLRMLRGKLGTISAMVLMSDGSGASLYHKATKRLAPAIGSIFEMVEEESPEETNAELHRFFIEGVRRATGDDCSIIVMVKASCNKDTPTQPPPTTLAPPPRAPRKHKSRLAELLLLAYKLTPRG